MSVHTYLSFLTGGAVLLAVTICPAVAQTTEEFSTRINTADLDLKSSQDVAVLHKRITEAAVRVCGSPDGNTLADWSRVWECRQAAVAKATSHADALVASAQSGSSYAQTAKATP